MKPSSVQSSLILDHTYIDLPSEDFEPLTRLTALLEGCEHAAVKTTDDEWEGIYLSTVRGSYFEFLKNRRPGGLGLALRLPPGSELDARTIVNERSDLPWQTGSRLTQSGAPWFDWLSLGDYPNTKDTWFNAWIMHYPKRAGHKPVTLPKRSIKELIELRVTLGKENTPEISKLGAWLPPLVPSSKDLLTLDLKDWGSNSFSLCIELIPGSEKFRFKHLVMELEGYCAISTQAFGNLEMLQTHNQLILRRSNSEGKY